MMKKYLTRDKKQLLLIAILTNLSFVALAFIETIPVMRDWVALLIFIPSLVGFYAAPIIFGIYIFLAVKSFMKKSNRIYTVILLLIGLVSMCVFVSVNNQNYDNPESLHVGIRVIEDIAFNSGVLIFAAVPVEIYLLGKYGKRDISENID